MHVWGQLIALLLHMSPKSRRVKRDPQRMSLTDFATSFDCFSGVIYESARFLAVD